VTAPEVRDQDGDLLLAGGVQHPRPGHLTDYRRDDTPARVPTEESWGRSLLLVLVVGCVLSALLICAGGCA